MSVTWKEMVKGSTLTATPTTQYTSPVLASAAIQAISVNNPTGGALTFDLYKVPPGMSSDQTTKICSRSIPAGAVTQPVEAINHKLSPGTQLFAAGVGLTLNISGVEYIPE